ncbi:glycosyltransferase involved in cell wall biosynthesis [Mucilaginibacter sp. UYNi724]
MKRVLYFFPDNLGQLNAGNKTRAIELLSFFKARGIGVDFATLKAEKRNFYNEDEALTFIKNNKLADNVFLLPRKPVTQNALFYFFKYKLWDLFYYLFTFRINSSIPTFLTIALKRAFQQLLKNKRYDHIIISYVQCADLISNKRLTGNAHCIVDTHDFITAQFKDKKRFNLGTTFEDEINRLNLFDEIWAISSDEQFIFSQFCKPPVKLLPVMLNLPKATSTNSRNQKYDIIYVASDNVHNQLAAKWFFDNVYPLLPKTVSICVIGKINNYLDLDKHITQLPFVIDLAPYYTDAKVAICPMFSGTGIKVKVVEALAYGLPVVCNTRGVDGLPNKTDNGCIVTDDKQAFCDGIISLLNNTKFYLQHSELAFYTFDNNFSRQAVFSILDGIFSNK